MAGVAVTGFVLAGGDSRRMGGDKARLAWGEATLLDHALDRLRRVTDDVRVLCGPRARYAEHGAPIVLDLVPGAGALGGLLTALASTTREWALLLAVDLPAVPSALLELLLERAHSAEEAGLDAVVPVTERGAEPLCAVYRRTSLSAIRRRLTAGDLRMTASWSHLRTATIGEADLSRFGPPATLFRNANTPEDYARACREHGPGASDRRS